MRKLSPITVFFIGSGIDGGRLCYYIGIVGNISYVVTRFPGNPVVGRGGDVAVIDIVFELTQVAYIVITAVILAKKKR